MPPQLIALAAALSYATSNIAAKRGMSHSNPTTVTYISLTIHAVGLGFILLVTGGIPEIVSLAVLLIVLAGLLQPVIRLFTYKGLFYIGASRGSTLRGTHPLFSTTFAILFLGEPATVPVLIGTLLIVAGGTLISWQPEGKKATYPWWYAGFPLGAALMAGIVHPVRRYALSLSNHPLFFAALVGWVSLFSLTVYLSLSSKAEKLVWNRRSAGIFFFAGVFETLGILLVMTGLSRGQVVTVSPIVATQPMWVLLGTSIFLRDLERITVRTVFGVLCVVAGTVAISLVR